MIKKYLILSCLLMGTYSPATEIKLSITLPVIESAEYHRPYVSAWLERGDKKIIENLAVWYKVKDEKGKDWLKDLRRWWRRGGRNLTLPIDGLSSATRPAGSHVLTFKSDSQFMKLPAGRYTLSVEAVRENGGRETVSIPFDWPMVTSQEKTNTGKRELGKITLAIFP